MILIFPGQGAQSVGMGADFYKQSPAALAVFKLADSELGIPLSDMILNGPEDSLKDTAIQQPAIVTVCVAIIEAMREAGIKTNATASAGLSLGEYAALYAAGAFDVRTCIRLVAKRGALMKSASDIKPCGMSVILKVEPDIIAAACASVASETGRVISPANFNCEGQVVISGELAALEAAENKLKEQKARVMRLPVSGAFHSALMQPAADGLRDALKNADIRRTAFPVYANVDAKPVSEPDDIRDRLIRQLTAPVLWMASMKALIASGETSFLEIGPGATLAGMMKRIDAAATVASVNSVEAMNGLR